MNKEEILKISQLENSGKPDERELAAMGKASRTGMAAGAFLCVALIIVGKIILDNSDLAAVGWMVYFTMQGCSNIALFKQLKNRQKLIYGIMEIALAVAFAVILVLRALRGVI